MKILIVVDMQNDFIDGSLGSADAAAIVPNVVKRIAEAEDELVLFTKDTHDEDYLQTSEGKKLPVPHCIKGTDGREINNEVFGAWQNNKNSPRLENPDNHVLEKPVFACFSLLTALNAVGNQISSIEICGLCTDICVVSNAILLKNALPETEVSVIADCCAGVTKESHEAALTTMKMCHINII